jgi:hypothetical protein
MVRYLEAEASVAVKINTERVGGCRRPRRGPSRPGLSISIDPRATRGARASITTSWVARCLRQDTEPQPGQERWRTWA